MKNPIQFRFSLLLMTAFLFCFTIGANAQQTKSKADQISNASKQISTPIQTKDGKLTSDTETVKRNYKNANKQKRVIHEPGKGPDYNGAEKQAKTNKKKTRKGNAYAYGKNKKVKKGKKTRKSRTAANKRKKVKGQKKLNTNTTVE